MTWMRPLLLLAALVPLGPAMADASAAPGPPASLAISAEPGDVRFAFGEHAAAQGLSGDAAAIVCDDLAERLSLCFTFLEGETRRYVTKADLKAWSLDREVLRAKALAGAAGKVGSGRPAATSVEGGGSYWLSAESDGWDVAALLQPEVLAKVTGAPRPVVAVPQRNTLLAWNPGVEELDTILAVGVRRMHDAAEKPVSPLLYRWDGTRWQVWGEAIQRP